MLMCHFKELEIFSKVLLVQMQLFLFFTIRDIMFKWTAEYKLFLAPRAQFVNWYNSNS